jgi:hypothetical protein
VGGADLGGVLGGEDPEPVAAASEEGLGLTALLSGEAAPSVLSGEAAPSVLSFWVGLLRLDSGLGDRPLLLDSLVLPGGGDEEGLPSNEDSSSGGRVLRET